MITLLVPTFKPVWPVGSKHHSYQYEKHVEVKVSNTPSYKDYQKVVTLLPGIACGYCSGFYNITTESKPLPITRFYDIRQPAAQKLLKNFFITVKN